MYSFFDCLLTRSFLVPGGFQNLSVALIGECVKHKVTTVLINELHSQQHVPLNNNLEYFWLTKAF